jgi:hypothetical protein
MEALGPEMGPKGGKEKRKRTLKFFFYQVTFIYLLPNSIHRHELVPGHPQPINRSSSEQILGMLSRS